MTRQDSSQLLLVRHAESLGNVAREESEASDAETITIDVRDADVALTSLGEGQAVAFGQWLAELPRSGSRLGPGSRRTVGPGRRLRSPSPRARWNARFA